MSSTLITPPRRRPLPAWPVVALFGGVGVWWALGALFFVPTLAALIMLVLMARRGARWLPGLGPWFALLAWVIASGVNVLGGTSVLAYGMRLMDVFDAAVIAVYVASAREALTRRTIVATLSTTWLTMVALGWAGQIAPGVRLPTPMATLLPQGLLQNSLIQDFVRPPLTETQFPWGAAQPFHRTAAPFPYANTWGQAYAMLTPVVIAWLHLLRSWRTRALWILLLVASIVPAMATSNRGMLAALGVCVVAAAIHLALSGRGRAAFAVFSCAVVAAAVVWLSGALERIGERLSVSSSTSDRLLLYERTLEAVVRRPWLGHGAPVLDPVVGVPLGTQGMVWYLLFCFGVPGLLFFLWFMVGVLVRGHRSPDVPGSWLYAALFGMLPMLPFYSLSSVPMLMLVVLAVVVLRDAGHATPTARRYVGITLPGGPSSARGPSGPLGGPPGAAASPGTGASGRARDAAAAASRTATTGNSLSTFGLVIIGALLAFGTTLIVGNVAGAASAGVFFQVIAFFNIALIAGTIGADTGLVRAVSAAVATGRADTVPQLLRIALVPVAAVSSLIAIALVLVAPTLDTLAPGLGVAEAVRIAAPFIPAGSLMTALFGALRGLGKVRRFSLLQSLLLPGLRLAGVGLALGVGATLVPLSAAWAVPVAIVALLAAAAVHRASRAVRGATAGPRAAVGGPSQDLGTPRAFWSFSGARGVSALVETALEWIDVICVGLFLGPAAAGAYGAVNRCVRLGSMLDLTARLVTGPQLAAAAARGERRAALGLYASTTRILVVAAWPFYLLLALFAPAVLGLFGEGFDTAAEPMVLICLAMMIAVTAGGVQSLLLMAGRSRWQLINKCVALAVALIGCLTLIPTWGLWGAVMSWSASVLVDAGLATLQVWFRLGFAPPLRSLVRPAASAVVCFGGAGWLLGSALGQHLWVMVLAALLGAAGYVVAILRRPGRFGLARQVRAVRRRFGRGSASGRAKRAGEEPRPGGAKRFSNDPATPGQDQGPTPAKDQSTDAVGPGRVRDGLGRRTP